MSMFTTNSPHFFKIILNDTLRSRKLWIPRKFVLDYGDSLSNQVLLKVPSGEVWDVELTKCDGGIWLHKGWQEFAEYYSLDHGHFLVFRYEGNCHFHVLIFDKSTTEIEYPYSSRHIKESNIDGEFQEHNMEETEDDVSIEILDDITPRKKARGKSPLPCPRPHKVMRTNTTNNSMSTSKLHSSVPYIRANDIQSAGMNHENYKIDINSPSTTQKFRGLNFAAKLSTHEKSKAFQRASAFKSENPFFMVVMQPSYVGTRSRLCVPSDFARKYLTKNYDVVLCISDGRTWSAKSFCGACSGNPRAKFLNGWSEFAEDNNLKVGDVCVFELIKSTEIFLKVLIFPVVDDENCRQSLAEKDANCSLLLADERGANQMKSKRNLVTKIESDSANGDDARIFSPGDQSLPQRKCEFKQLIHEQSGGGQDTRSPCSSASRALEAASKFVTKNPFIKVVVRSCHLNHCILTLPIHFVKKYIKKEVQNVMLQVADRSWLVKLLQYSSSGMLSSGWSAFARENALQLGDVCVLELIEGSDAVLKVSIFRCAG